MDYLEIVTKLAAEKTAEDKRKADDLAEMRADHSAEVRHVLRPLIEILGQMPADKISTHYLDCPFNQGAGFVLPKFSRSSLATGIKEQRAWSIGLSHVNNNSREYLNIDEDSQVSLFSDNSPGYTAGVFFATIGTIDQLIPHLLGILADMSRKG